MTQPVTTHPLTVGERMANGATVVAMRPFPKPAFDGEMLLLCVRMGAVEPYVTWRSAPVPDLGTYDLYWGHYHRDFNEALLDYHRRGFDD